MQNKLYWIREEDYYRHIRDKVLFYSMLRHLTHLVQMLPANRDNKEVKDLADAYTTAAGKKLDSWKLPARYLLSDLDEDLAELAEKELITPAHNAPVCLDCRASAFKKPPTPELLAALRELSRKIYGDESTL